MQAGRPLLGLELTPPRGINGESLLKKLEAVRNHVDFVNLTDNALGRVKMSALVFASMIKARLGIPVVLNLSCRDRNRLALKSELLGAAALGIDAVVAVTGDKLASDGLNPIRPVGDVNAIGLLRMIGALNRGDTGEGRRPLKTLPSILPGAVANPNRRPLEREVALLGRKAGAGARFVITQPVFDREIARRFCAEAKNCGIQVMLGILPVKREAMAAYLRERIDDLRDSGSHLGRYAGMAESEARRFSLAYCMELMSTLGSEVAGFNVMSGGGPSLAIELALEFSRWRTQEAALPG